MNVFPPFLAAIQQNPLALHNQFVAASSNPRSSGVSPGLEDEDENYALAITEPEDLTVRWVGMHIHAIIRSTKFGTIFYSV